MKQMLLYSLNQDSEWDGMGQKFCPMCFKRYPNPIPWDSIFTIVCFSKTKCKYDMFVLTQLFTIEVATQEH